MEQEIRLKTKLPNGDAGTPIPIRRCDRICWLVYANGGIQPVGYGRVRYDGIHQKGLTQTEYLDLVHFSSLMDGVELAKVSIYKVFYTEFYVAYAEQFDKRYAERAAEQLNQENDAEEQEHNDG